MGRFTFCLHQVRPRDELRAIGRINSGTVFNEACEGLAGTTLWHGINVDHCGGNPRRRINEALGPEIFSSHYLISKVWLR